MDDRAPFPLIIIGGGPAGISAAIWAARLGLKPLLLEKNEYLGGQVRHIRGSIVDYLGHIFPNGETLTEKMGHHLAAFPVDVRTGVRVEHITDDGTTYTLTLSGADRPRMTSQAVIIATGAQPRRLNVPGFDAVERDQHLSTSKDAPSFSGKRVAIIGGGDRAVEGAVNVQPYARSVHLIVRSDELRARRRLVDKLSGKPNITIHTLTQVREIIPSSDGKRLTLVHEKVGVSSLLVDYVLARIGMTAVLPPGAKERVGQGGFFLAGDCTTDAPFRSIATAVGDGMHAAKRAIFYLEAIERMQERMQTEKTIKPQSTR